MEEEEEEVEEEETDLCINVRGINISIDPETDLCMMYLTHRYRHSSRDRSMYMFEAQISLLFLVMYRSEAQTSP